MYKEILDALSTKFNGVSDAILSKMATKLAKTASTSEEARTAVEGLTFQQIIDAEADRRATEASQTAVQNYEKKHNLKDGKAIEGGENQPNPKPTPTQGGEQVPEWAKTLLEANKALTQRLDTIDKQRTQQNRQQQLESLTASLPENLRKPYARLSLEALSQDDFDHLLQEVGTEIESITSDLRQKGLVFNQPKQGHNTPTNTATTEELNEVAALLNL